jgi:hypothetical protein
MMFRVSLSDPHAPPRTPPVFETSVIAKNLREAVVLGAQFKHGKASLAHLEVTATPVHPLPAEVEAANAQQKS